MNTTDTESAPSAPAAGDTNIAVKSAPSNLDLVLDVSVDLWVQLGTCRLPMREILDLAIGTVLQLEQNSKEPVKLFVNEKLVALGEVVVVDDHFGIKVTQLSGEQVS